MSRIPFRLFALLTLVFASFTLSGAMCENLANIKVTVNKDLEFTLDVDKAMQNAGIKPVNGKVPDQVPSKEIPVDFAQSVDLTTNAQVKKHKSVLKEVYINSVTVEVVGDNTLTVDIPQVKIAMANAGATDFAGAEIGTFPGITAGKTGEKTSITWVPNGQKRASDHLIKFAMAVQAATKLVVQGGQKFPAGKAKIKMNLNVTFTVNPLSTGGS